MQTNEQIATTLNARIESNPKPQIMQTTISRARGVGDLRHISVALDPFPDEHVVSLVRPDGERWTADDVRRALAGR